MLREINNERSVNTPVTLWHCFPDGLALQSLIFTEIAFVFRIRTVVIFSVRSISYRLMLR